MPPVQDGESESVTMHLKVESQRTPCQEDIEDVHWTYLILECGCITCLEEYLPTMTNPEAMNRVVARIEQLKGDE